MSKSVNQVYLLGSFSCIEDFVLCLYSLFTCSWKPSVKIYSVRGNCVNKRLFGKVSLLVCFYYGQVNLRCKKKKANLLYLCRVSLPLPLAYFCKVFPRVGIAHVPVEICRLCF